MKYPRTPYWPWSPSRDRADRVHEDPAAFVGVPVVATEKLDGSNTLLHAGQVYGRSVAVPSRAAWYGMVKKHHAWKVTESDVYLYGEDIYGVHSITYDAIAEDRTFHAFAMRNEASDFAAWAELEKYATEKNIPVVPVIFKGTFASVSEICDFIETVHREDHSMLGGPREGVVIRHANAFAADEFGSSVCKSVRPNHVQADEHWSKNWKPCRLA